jgi:hypothetical protein
MRDENQIAFGILRTLTLTEPRPGEDPQHRHQRALGLKNIGAHALKGGRASAEKVPQTEAPAQQPKNKAAVALGKMGGKKGGAARAASLTHAQRSEIAKKAAKKRWAEAKPPEDGAAPLQLRAHS